MSTHMKANLIANAIAIVALSAYTAVKYDGTGGIVAAGAGEGIGVIQDAPLAGDSCEVAIGGGLGKLAGTVAAGDFLKSNASGELIAVTTDKDLYVAMAMESGVVGDVISINAGAGFYAT